MRRPTSPLTRDGLLAAVLTAATQVELVLAGSAVEGPLAVQHLGFALMTGAVALRRRAPVAAAATVGAGLLLNGLAGDAPVVGGFVAMLVVLASIGYHVSLRRGALGVAAIGVGGLAAELGADDVVWGDVVGNVVIVLGAWLGSSLLRANVDRAVAAEVARDRATQEAARSERTRIARELHDSVAHALTVITLHAGGAREQAVDGPVRESLGHIEATSRQAVTDMHRFLQALDAGAADTPGLRDVEGLLAGVRAAGLTVEVEVTGDLDALPASLSATAYRVVQEGLTNVLKHSGGQRARVEVSRVGGILAVAVTDEGGSTPRRDGAGAGSGRGLSGLRERVALFGGELAAAPTTEGGWRLAASVPMEPASP